MHLFDWSLCLRGIPLRSQACAVFYSLPVECFEWVAQKTSPNFLFATKMVFHFLIGHKGHRKLFAYHKKSVHTRKKCLKPREVRRVPGESELGLRREPSARLATQASEARSEGPNGAPVLVVEDGRSFWSPSSLLTF